MQQIRVYLVLTFLCWSSILNQVNCARWTVEQANSWYESQPLFFGANFVPSTAVNAIDVWQTFDVATIERELKMASDINMNIIRVNLHYLVYQQDPEDYYKKMDGFLSIADKFNIKVMFILFNECWLPDPKLGPQPDPIPGVHNSQWVRCPGQPLLLDTSKWPLLKQYTIDLLTRFSNDSRIVIWDLYNEPECSKQVPVVLPFAKEVYSAAVIANPRQPLTFGVASFNFSAPLAQFELESSDIITFHNYEPLAETMQRVAEFRKWNRPLICTEYMARTVGSTFHTHTFYFHKEKIGAVSFGLVAGKIQTYFPWRSPVNASIPLVWFHDIFNRTGEPYSRYEIQFFKDLKKSNAK